MSVFNMVKDHYDLAAHVESDLGRPARQSGKWRFWLCPFHRETVPSFGVNIENNSFHCYGCGFHGSIIDYHMQRQALSDPLTAARELAALAGLAIEGVEGNEDHAQTPLPEHASKPKPRPAPPGVNIHAEPPPGDWQAKARAALAEVLCPSLWKPEGDKARAWLKARGIDEEAMIRYHLGYTPGGEVGGLRFAMGRGIVIPHYYYHQGIEAIYALKVRRPVPSGIPNKYYCATGSKPGASFYNAPSLLDRDICFVVEGEFDCLALHSQMADLAAVITLGSKSARIADFWLAHLLHIERFYIATDAHEDEAAAEYWLELVGHRGIRVLPPGGCKDVCQAAEQGYDLRQWAMEVMGLSPSPDVVPERFLDLRSNHPGARRQPQPAKLRVYAESLAGFAGQSL
jgi:hypothetical protein